MAPTPMTSIGVKNLLQATQFTPNPPQWEAITCPQGPMYLIAGPGAGKTKVLLWRTLFLLVDQKVPPHEICLATFSRRAAQQLIQGIHILANIVSQTCRVSLDLTPMYVGTIHSICQRLLTDHERFPAHCLQPVRLLDEVEQYLFLQNPKHWQHLTQAAPNGLSQIVEAVGMAYGNTEHFSKYAVVSAVQACLNRFSEEMLSPETIRPASRLLADIYDRYLDLLEEHACTDYAGIQKKAIQFIETLPVHHGFSHVIIDEYQDTNPVQERLAFLLAQTTKNICVVGDDDQSLYRFRGSTVENFTRFPSRCCQYLQTPPRTITLETNYRSQQPIVAAAHAYIQSMSTVQRYRTPKSITGHRGAEHPSVLITSASTGQKAILQTAQFIRDLIQYSKVADPSHIAILFPSVKSKKAQLMREALESLGLRVYAPRATKLLEEPAVMDMLAIFLHIFGHNPETGVPKEYAQYIENLYTRGAHLQANDPEIAKHISDSQQQLEYMASAFRELAICFANRMDEVARWDELETMVKRHAFSFARNIRKTILSPYIRLLLQRRQEKGKPLTYRQLTRRVTTLSWTVLDLFYKLLGCRHFLRFVETVDDQALGNLGKLSQNIQRFMKEDMPVITGELLDSGRFQAALVNIFFAIIHRLETAYEHEDVVCPSGAIPMLTIHQAKGLEFPVVVLGDIAFQRSDPKFLDYLIASLTSREDAEPIEETPKLDTARLYYVGLTRAKDMLVLVYGKNNKYFPGFERIIKQATPIPQVDVQNIPPCSSERIKEVKTYSFTTDILNYQKCPRNYMFFRRYKFANTQTHITTVFGELVHSIVKGLHKEIIRRKQAGEPPQSDIVKFIVKIAEIQFNVINKKYDHILTNRHKIFAIYQVVAYWYKLNAAILRVSHAEHRIILPHQTSPGGAEYMLEGVLDAVLEGNIPCILDIKTHNKKTAVQLSHIHQQQLAAYAHLWANAHPQHPIPTTAVVALGLPQPIRNALKSRDKNRIREAIQQWESPILPIQCTPEVIHSAMQSFGAIVDDIEARRFPAIPATRDRSALHAICGKCQARLGCPSYQDAIAPKTDPDSPQAAPPKNWYHDFLKILEANQTETGLRQDVVFA